MAAGGRAQAPAQPRLHAACQASNNLDAVRKLLKTEAADRKDGRGKTALHAVACADAAPGINRSARFTYRAKGADPTPRTLSLYVEPDELLDGVKAAFGIPATCDCRFYTRESVIKARETLRADERCAEFLKDPNEAAKLAPLLEDSERIVWFLADDALRASKLGKLVADHAPTRLSAKNLVEGRSKNFWDMCCVAATEVRLPTTRYKVEVHTVKKSGAGTDANVRVILQGKNSGPSLLQATNIREGSPLWKPEKAVANGKSQNFAGWHELTAKADRSIFQPGGRDAFIITDHNLGELTMMRIGHDGSGFGPAWLLDKVVVTMEDTGKAWEFNCGRWLDEKKAAVPQVDAATGATTGSAPDPLLVVGSDNYNVLIARDLKAVPLGKVHAAAKDKLSMAASSAIAGSQDENTYTGTQELYTGMPRASAYNPHADRPGVAALLLEKAKDRKALLSATTHEGHTALHLAARNGHTELARVLIEAGAALGVGDGALGPPAQAGGAPAPVYGDTPLHLAAYNGQFEIARFLLEEDDKRPTNPRLIVQQNGMGWNVLHWAAHGQRPGPLSLLLQKAEQMGILQQLLEQKDIYGRQAVHIAAKGRLPKVLEMLLDRGASPVAVAEYDGGRQIPYHLASVACKPLLFGPVAEAAPGAPATGVNAWRAATAQWLRDN